MKQCTCTAYFFAVSAIHHVSLLVFCAVFSLSEIGDMELRKRIACNELVNSLDVYNYIGLPASWLLAPTIYFIYQLNVVHDYISIDCISTASLLDGSLANNVKIPQGITDVKI